MKNENTVLILKGQLNYRLINEKFSRILLVSIFLFSLVFFSGCRLLRFNDPERKAEKKQEKENKKLAKAYQAEVKAHYKMQTKETRKRMNKNLNKVSKGIRKKGKGKSKWNCS